MESEVRNRKNQIIKIKQNEIKKKIDDDDNERFVQEKIGDELILVKEKLINNNVVKKNITKKVEKNVKITENNDVKNNNFENSNNQNENDQFTIKLEFNLMTIFLFVIAFITRVYKLSQPGNVVFDELHYGKYVSMYMKKQFFFDQHPPLGKQLIAGISYLVNYDGNYTFARIGNDYTTNVPIFWLRFIPSLSSSMLAPSVYKLLLQMKLNKWTATLGGFLIIFDNAILTQSRFILMESMLLLFSILGLLFLLKSQQTKIINFKTIFYAILSAMFFTFAVSVKYVGFYSCCLGIVIICKYLWNLLADKKASDFNVFGHIILKWTIFTIIPTITYLGIFYVHLSLLQKAGPHDFVMTSAFQASLEGGLASITKGQPMNVVHGSQITLRHTHGRTCWMHSHSHVYPIKYADKRGSSHQQQVTCYSFKDVNNWWIVKRPSRVDLVVGDQPDIIRDGDEIQLVHGITSRALNSHDVAAPVSPQCQEVSCYIDYNVSMPSELLWKVEIVNKDQEVSSVWRAITSQIRLIHVTTGQALRFSGRQLPDWGFNQHEVVADRVIIQPDTVWNVEEHRYTKTEDQKERERQMLSAEMIPTSPTRLTFWAKFVELQLKMLWFSDQIQSHMYSSDPIDWPFMNKGIAYWVDKNSNAQIHLLGNIAIWYSATISLVIYITFMIFYLLRRRRLIFDLNLNEWDKFKYYGEVFLSGYLIHFLPYIFVERTLFLHCYLPAFVFKIMLLCCVIEHIYFILKNLIKFNVIVQFYKLLIIIWILFILLIFKKFSVLSYGTTKLTADDVISLRWKDTWDFILHKDLP